MKKFIPKGKNEMILPDDNNPSVNKNLFFCLCQRLAFFTLMYRVVTVMEKSWIFLNFWRSHGILTKNGQGHGKVMEFFFQILKYIVAMQVNSTNARSPKLFDQLDLLVSYICQIYMSLFCSS